MVEYLQTPTETVRKCLEALNAIAVRVVTNPAGARIMVDGRFYGKSPIDVQLTGDWRNSEIIARFDRGEDTIDVLVTYCVSGIDRNSYRTRHAMDNWYRRK